jgi:pyruvate,water dikinase
MYVKRIRDLTSRDVSAAGGKGASLGEMTKAGISVPDGFVVLADAFKSFLESSHLNSAIHLELDSVNKDDNPSIELASERIQAMIMESSIADQVGTEVEALFKELGVRYVAVRSSATAEDSASASWAGQLQSYLFTREKDLMKNVKKCWASLFSPRAILYRFMMQLDKRDISVAVVVQKMVDSDVAGVAFSVHPVTKDKNQLVIEAGWGLGETVASGQITPDSYVVDKTDFTIVAKQAGKQQKQLVMAKEGGAAWVRVKKPDEEKLCEKSVIKLAKLVCRIERHFGFPVDVEWAVEKDELYILQSRPITTLKNS